MLKDEVLFLLESAKKEMVSGGELARSLSVSRAAVWKAVNVLKKEGYVVESVEKRGYRLVSTNDIPAEPSIRKTLRTQFAGNRIEVLKTVDSTNAYMKRKDLPALPEGYVVIADAQTCGKGRRGRLFRSCAGQGLYLSLLLKPNLPPTDTQFLTICAALAVCRTLEEICGLAPAVKWVNDVYCDGLKICGILTEGTLSLEQRSMSHIVLGIGINTGDVPEEIRDIATSVLCLTGRRPDRNALAAELLARLETACLDLTVRGRKKELLDEYRDRQFIFGRTVDVVDPGTGEFFEAVPTEIDDDGALVVRTKAGETLRLRSEEVSLRL